jgi:DNA polymerase III subunit delta
VYQLGEAALAGDVPRSLRILEGLRAEGAEPPLVLWALCRELRALADVRHGIARKAYGAAQERHLDLVRCAAKRTAGQSIERWFEAAAHIDRQVKGQSESKGNPWTSLTGLVASISGAHLPSAMLRG